MNIFRIGAEHKLAGIAARKYAKKNIVIKGEIPQKAYETLLKAKDVIANYAKSKDLKIIIDNSVYHDSINIKTGKSFKTIENVIPQRFVIDEKESSADFLKRFYDKIRFLSGDEDQLKNHVMLTRKSLSDIGKIQNEERHRMDWRDFKSYME